MIRPNWKNQGLHDFLMDGPTTIVGESCSVAGCSHISHYEPYRYDGVQPTNFKTPRLVLSGIGLAFNLIANGLIVMRFSVTTSYWKLATQLFLYCWIAKVSYLHLSACLIY